MSFEPGARGSEGFIPLCVPEVRGNEWKYIKACLDTGWVSSVGSYVDRFEKELAGYIGVKHGVAMVNGTAALHIALLVAGVQPDDEVLVSSLTFIAPVNAIRYVKAWPVFIDSEPEHWQADAHKAAAFLESGCRWDGAVLRNKQTGRRVSAIIPVHVLGHPVDLDPFLALAKHYKLMIIEDATECLGATYKGRRVGSLGHIGCFSFNGNKIITTGGGGMLVTDNAAFAAKSKYLSTQAKDDPIEYIHHEIGYNYRLTNIQAAMGCAQLEHLDEYIATKRRISSRYDKALSDVPGLTILPQAAWAESICWMYTIQIDESMYGESSRALLNRLGESQIQARPLWQPAHMSSAHQGGVDTGCEVSVRLNRDALSLPCSVGITPDQQDRVIDVLRRQ